MRKNKFSLTLISGFSNHLLNMIMFSKTDPYKVVSETINSERDQPIKKAVEKIIQ